MGTLITPHGEAIVEEDDLNQNRETDTTPRSWCPTQFESDGWLDTAFEIRQTVVSDVEETVAASCQLFAV